MEQLYKLKDTFLGYLSPKRRRTVGPSTANNQPLQEQHTFLPDSDSQGTKAQAALRERISQKYSSSSDSRFGAGSRKRAREEDSGMEVEYRSDIDMDMDMDIDSMEHEVSPDESASQITSVDGSNVDSDSEGENEEDEVVEQPEEDVSPQDKVDEWLKARAEELEMKKGEIEKVKALGDWHPDEVSLFERLSLRSFEPLLSEDFKYAFPTLPEDIWAKSKEAFITNNNTGVYYAVKALEEIMEIGRRMPDIVDNEGAPHALRMSVALKHYIKWSEIDGGYDTLRFFPTLVVVIAKKNQSTARIMKTLDGQMKFLASQHREHLSLLTPRTNELGELEIYSRQPPLLYGFVIAGRSKVIVLTLDSADPEAVIRLITSFDLADRAQAIWNGIGIAIVVCAARQPIMGIKDELEPDSEEEDVDA